MTETTHRPSRRTLLRGSAVAAAAAGAGPLRLFDVAAANAAAKKGIFGYGVASGDPTADAVMIWTRATPPPRGKGDPVATPGSGLGAPLNVTWEMSLDEDFHRIVRRGVVRTSPASDHTVKVDVTGLATYTRYWYRFRAEGEVSPVGRTQTAPDEANHVHALRFALVSCSNYNGGYFTTYRAIGERADLDFVLHVGDYIYEYGNGADRYGPPALVGKRDTLPDGEILVLTDYRLRHAVHKADPDLQKAHAQHPFIAIFDDHEVANNTWATGAENHTPGVEGDFAARRQAAYQAYLEWLPFRLPEQQTVPHQGTRFFKKFTFGSLGDLSVLETRQNRSRQIDVPPFTTTGGGFIPSGISPAVDGALAAPSRHLPEPDQLAWLEDGLGEQRAWHLVGNQVILAPIRFPGAIFGAPGFTLLNSDQWDGYAADQGALLAHLAGRPAAAGDVVVLTGDIHSSWATDLPSAGPAPGTAAFVGTPYDSVGVEFVCPSVTSDGFYEIATATLTTGGVTPPAEVVADQTDAAAGFVGGYNAWVKYLDGIGHGYVLVDVTPERVQADFFHTPRPTSALPDPRTDPSVEPAYKASWQTLAGSRRLSTATAPIGARSDEPHESGGKHGRAVFPYPARVRHGAYVATRKPPAHLDPRIDLRSLKD
ncbi:MAG: alkaline phosphatase D family protein [Nocardioides sp.]